MRTKSIQKHIAYAVIAVMITMIAIPAFASITGSANVTNHDLVLTSPANYNIIQCDRSLKVTSSYVKGTSGLSWYTFSGNAAQLAYCNAITGILTVSINATASNNETMMPKSTTVEWLGQELSSGVSCYATRTHNLDLISAQAVTTVIVYTPDGALMKTYQKTLTLE